MNAVGVEFGETAIPTVMLNERMWKRKKRGGVVRRKIIMATPSKVSEVGILVPVRGGSVPAMRSRTSYPGDVHS